MVIMIFPGIYLAVINNKNPLCIGNCPTTESHYRNGSSTYFGAWLRGGHSNKTYMMWRHTRLQSGAFTFILFSQPSYEGFSMWLSNLWYWVSTQTTMLEFEIPIVKFQVEICLVQQHLSFTYSSKNDDFLNRNTYRQKPLYTQQQFCTDIFVC